jgi:DNA-binding SARP family transcriptional activator
VPFLTRLCHAAYGMITGDGDLVAAVVADCDHRGDRAGAALAAVLGALGAVWGPGAPRPVGPDVVERCQDARVPTLELWALVARALAARGTPEGSDLADTAVLAARRKGLRPLLELAELARGGSSGGRATASGIAVPAATTVARAATVDGDEAAVGTPVALRFECLGRFVAHRSGAPLELGELRPRARTVLRMLAVNLSTGVHRQLLFDELWPDDDEEAAARKLQVAVSSIRRVLDLQGCPGVLVRRGDVYALDVTAGVSCDVADLERAAADGRALAAQGAAADAEPAQRRALGLYTGELLPEEGAADWVVRARDVLRAALVETARSLAHHLLDVARFTEAADACRTGLAVDRYCDPLWRLLVAALEAGGDLAETARTVAQYDEVLAELGVTRDGPPARGPVRSA